MNSNDNSIYHIESNTWSLEREEHLNTEDGPTSWELYEEFRELLSVSKSKETGLINISIEYYSPGIASDWVNKIIQSINNFMRQQDIQEAQNNIKFLEQQISLTSIADMQSVFYQLIEEQTKTLMLAQASEEYVLKTVSEAKIPEEKSKPRRAIICVIGTLIGFIFSSFIVLAIYIFKRQ